MCMHQKNRKTASRPWSCRCTGNPVSPRGPWCRPLRAAGRARRGTCLVLHCLWESGPDHAGTATAAAVGNNTVPLVVAAGRGVEQAADRGMGSGAGGGSRARGERAAWGRYVRELGEWFGSRNERMVFLTDDGLFIYHGFVTITTSSCIISKD
jgi:hypothetical protein